jgi:hypothetical protein
MVNIYINQISLGVPNKQCRYDGSALYGQAAAGRTLCTDIFIYS